MYIANDYSQFMANGRDSNAVFQRAKQVINIASALFQPLNLYLVLVGMEAWTDGDRIQIVSSAINSTLSSWCDYRMRNITPIHYNDDGILLTHAGFNFDVIGGSNFGQMCSNRFSASIVCDQATSAASTGAALAHQIGHNFGLSHDSAGCSCTDHTGYCIMSSNLSVTATTWSSCSTNQLAAAFQLYGLDICLYNVPQTLFDSSASVCGNGIVENGEQCDCGRAPQSECNSTCCNSATCQLTEQSTCASGRCCDLSKCRVLKAGSICRPMSGDCDLPEWCDGTQALCPPDTYRPDGANCIVPNGDAVYCYKGQCRSHKSQCELLWGPGTPASNPVCFYQLNTHGENNGNCGMNWLPSVTYIPCQRNDSMCGRLFCENNSTTLHFYRNYYSMARLPFYVYTCNSIIFDYGLITQDPGLAPDGAKCGDQQMCISQKCVNINDLPTVSCASACHPDEVCNNVGQCQSTSKPGQPTNTAGVHGGAVEIVVFITLQFSLMCCLLS